MYNKQRLVHMHAVNPLLNNVNSVKKFFAIKRTKKTFNSHDSWFVLVFLFLHKLQVTNDAPTTIFVQPVKKIASDVKKGDWI